MTGWVVESVAGGNRYGLGLVSKRGSEGRAGIGVGGSK